MYAGGINFCTGVFAIIVNNPSMNNIFGQVQIDLIDERDCIVSVHDIDSIFCTIYFIKQSFYH